MPSVAAVLRGARTGPVRLYGALLVGLLVASCGGGGGGGTGDPTIFLNPATLKLVSVNCDRRDNWDRNGAIEFRFSAPLSLDSLDPEVISRALQIGIVTSKGRVPAKGTFYFPTGQGGMQDSAGRIRDRLIFDPTRMSKSDDLACADNPFGFSPLTTYTITIPTPATSKKYLKASNGKPIYEAFNSYFKTSEKYSRELRQPKYVGVDGLGSLGFEPPRKPNGVVPYNARVLIVFDEAMDPASFEMGNTINVNNDTLTAQQGVPATVSGTFAPDICGRTWKFTPSFSFGGAGYDISVTLTTGLKDLAGNPLTRSQVIRFRTEVKIGEPTTQSLSESFDNTTFRDTGNTTADWGTATPGALTGGAITESTATVQLLPAQYPGGLRTRIAESPFYGPTSPPAPYVPRIGQVGHEQWLYLQSEIGPPGAITQIAWGPSSNALFASYHTNVKVTLGHTQGTALGIIYANNFDSGFPVTVLDSSYTIPQRYTIDPPCGGPGSDLTCAVGFWPLPAFSDFFEFNGKNNLIVDIDSSMGTNYQISRCFFGPATFPNRQTFTGTGGTTGVLLQPLVFDAKFTKKRRTTIAQSTFYKAVATVPDYGTPVVLPATQTGGTAVGIEYEGAKGISFPTPLDPTNVIPDPTTFTGFVTSIDQLDGYRFIRFRATLIANVVTGQVPVVRSIDIPYIF